MENKEIQKEVYVLNSIKRLKHYVAIFAFGSPFIHFGFNFLISTVKWNTIYTNPNPIQLIWCLTVPITTLILVLMEACGERIKRHPCYYCATLFIYESLCILSLFAYFSALLSMNHIDQWIGFVRRTPYAILFLICAGIFYCSQWLRYTSEHMMLSWCKITGTQRISGFIGYFYIDFWDTLGYLLVIPFVYSAVMVLINYAPDESCFPSYCELLFVYGSLMIHGVVKLASYILAKCQLKYLKLDCMCFIVALICIFLKLGTLPVGNGLNFSDSILNWIFFLSIGRKFFLDMESNRWRYENYFVDKFNKMITTSKIQTIE